MDVFIYTLSVPAVLLAGYIVSTRQKMRVALAAYLYPIIINGIDVFVDGNLTTFRQITFALWGYLVMWAVITNNGSKER